MIKPNSFDHSYAFDVTRYDFNLRENNVYKLSQILASLSNGVHVYSGLCAVGPEYGLSIFKISCIIFE